MLQEKLEEPISEPPSPRQFADGEDAVEDLASHITSLREEIRRLKQQLAKSEADCKYLPYRFIIFGTDREFSVKHRNKISSENLTDTQDGKSFSCFFIVCPFLNGIFMVYIVNPVCRK